MYHGMFSYNASNNGGIGLPWNLSIHLYIFFGPLPNSKNQRWTSSLLYFSDIMTHQNKPLYCLLTCLNIYLSVTFILKWCFNIEYRRTVAINVSGWLIYLALSFQISFTLVCNISNVRMYQTSSIFYAHWRWRC